MNRRNVTIWGLGASIAAAYLVVAGLTFRSGVLPVRPFFEGTAPPQSYRWVKVPQGQFFEGSTVGAQPGSRLVKLGPEAALAVSTGDGQAILSLSEGSIGPAAGETEVTVTITPLDPETLGPPPAGLEYDSNAYRIEATYAQSGSPARFAADSCPRTQQPKICPTLVMRYAKGANGLYRREGRSWLQIDATLAETSLQIFGDVPEAGTFVAAGHFAAAQAPGPPVARYVALALGGVAVLAAALAGGTRRGRRWLKVLRTRVQRWLRGKPPAPRGQTMKSAKQKESASRRPSPKRSKKRKRK